jgi:hypothetical protein
LIDERLIKDRVESVAIKGQSASESDGSSRSREREREYLEAVEVEGAGGIE